MKNKLRTKKGSSVRICWNSSLKFNGAWIDLTLWTVKRVTKEGIQLGWPIRRRAVFKSWIVVTP